ncbi:hypothetical protein [Bifidobacterium sp. UTBIF-78]|uniref:hypothetical protein n=1 Tax=Bifidobacterium sp. UTBIF-78 TaxID=1465263 RepID=UPI001127331B|nr:hypothetical protein [Bifidobacterium sp. UTBIF-78]TPF95284.1 hypothetical protein BG22_02835 [Bifidobacterium sp. UTBIF-78]
MSRTWKDRPYRVMQNEAAKAGCLRPPYYSRHKPAPLVPDVKTYAYVTGRDVHIPARRFTICHLAEDWDTDYGSRRAIRDALKAAIRDANSGIDMRDWDHPIAYQRRRRWIG